MLRFKSCVRMGAAYPDLLPVLRFVCEWSTARGIDVRMTSAADAAPRRSANSLHPDDLAWDFALGTPVPDRAASLSDLARYLRRRLGDPYDVIAHGPGTTIDHVHVESDKTH